MEDCWAGDAGGWDRDGSEMKWGPLIRSAVEVCTFGVAFLRRTFASFDDRAFLHCHHVESSVRKVGLARCHVANNTSRVEG